jgi:hypothetical protein
MNPMRAAGCALLLSACASFAPRGPVDLHEYHVVATSIAAKRARQSVCPGEDVPLELTVDAIAPGDDHPQRMHTHREALDDWIFDPRAMHLTSNAGTIDDDAILHANADPLASVTTGFVVDVRTRTTAGSAR